MKKPALLGSGIALLAVLVIMLSMPAIHAAATAPLTSAQTCSFGALDPNDWVQINFLVVIAALTIAGLVYSLSSFLPAGTRERLRGAVKTEGAEAILSIVIILALLGFSTFTCGIVATESSSLQGVPGGGLAPFQFANYYVGSLLFTKGTGIVQALYGQTVSLLISASIVNWLAGSVLNGNSRLASYPLNLEVQTPIFSITLQMSNNLSEVFYSYGSIYTEVYATLVVVTFGLLLILFLLLPAIQATALTIAVPVALIMRSLPFGGPRLRQASDAILALAIAFFFILPLTLALNAYIVNWMFSPSLNPYEPFLGSYMLNSLPTYALFQSSTISSTAICGSGNGLCAIGNLQVNFFNNPFSTIQIGSVLTTMLGIPQTYENLGNAVAEYIFEGIVLLAVDTAIIIGFAQGLSKGLGSLGSIIGAGSFWGA